MEENLTFNDLKGFSELLDDPGSAKPEVILRKGTVADVFPSQNKEILEEKVPAVAAEAGNTASGYTEEDFNREFGGDVIDADEAFDNDGSRKDLSSDAKVIERQEMGVDDLAGTISSDPVFNADKQGKLFIITLKLPDEDPRTVDIQVEDENKVLL